MKTIYTFALGIIMLTSCGSKSNTTQGITKNIDVTTFKAKLNDTKDAQLLDVRTPAEWDNGIIQNATLINIFDTEFQTKVKQLEKDKPVLVYCASGGRSSQAMSTMNEMGFTEVYNLSGGISNWKAQGETVVAP